MTADTQSTTVPSVAYAAARFALGGFIGCVTLAATVPRGGVLALAAPPLAFFAGAFWAAGELHLGVRGRFGFGVAAAIATLGSILALVATQAMTGRENFFVALTVPFLIANAVGGVLGLLVILPGQAKVFAYAVVGFTVGSIVAGAIAAAAMGTHQLNFDTGLLLIPIPEIAGGTAAAWALTSRRRSPSESEQ